MCDFVRVKTIAKYCDVHALPPCIEYLFEVTCRQQMSCDFVFTVYFFMIETFLSSVCTYFSTFSSIQSSSL